MNAPRLDTILRAALGLAFIVGLPDLGRSQTTGRTQSLSSGSGEGTGTGTGAGAGINSTGGGTGDMTGPGSLRAGTIRGADAGFLSPDALRRAMQAPRVPLTPSPGTRSMPGLPTDSGLPLDNFLNPLYPNANELPALSAAQLDKLDAELLAEARKIVDPGDRALALSRTAKAKLFAKNYRQAHVALVEAGQAAMQLQPGLVRNLRIMAIVTGLMDLAHEDVQEGLINDDLPRDDTVTADPNAKRPPTPPRPLKQRLASLSAAAEEWTRAATLANQIQNHNFRSEQLYKVAESQASESQSIAHVAERASTDRKNDLEGQGQGLLDFSDHVLRLAQSHAGYIVRPVWRDRALLEITAKAAYSDQFPRALVVARTIPDPEIRTDALIRVAEGLARRNLGPEATRVYSEAARSVSEIPTDDIRGVIGGVLIDSLIATGRFDDARASIVLLPDTTRRLVALGAVAESQGRRGLADSARRWIARDAPPTYRSMLERKVDDGVLARVDQLRTQARTNMNK